MAKTRKIAAQVIHGGKNYARSPKGERARLPGKLPLPGGQRIDTALGAAAIGQLTDRELMEEILHRLMRLESQMDL